MFLVPMPRNRAEDDDDGNDVGEGVSRASESSVHERGESRDNQAASVSEGRPGGTDTWSGPNYGGRGQTAVKGRVTGATVNLRFSLRIMPAVECISFSSISDVRAASGRRDLLYRIVALRASDTSVFIPRIYIRD